MGEVLKYELMSLPVDPGRAIGLARPVKHLQEGNMVTTDKGREDNLPLQYYYG